MALGLGHSLGFLLEFIGEGNVVEEDVRVVKFVVPSSFDVVHSPQQVAKFLIANQRDQSGIGAR